MMLDYKIVDAKDKDVEIITSMKLVTMIDDEMDKILSYEEKEKNFLLNQEVFIVLKPTCYKNFKSDKDEYRATEDIGKA